MTETRRQFGAGAGAAFGLQVAAMGAALGVQLAYTHGMSREAYGVLAQALAGALLASNLLNQGIPGASLQLLPPLVASEAWGRYRALASWGLRAAAGASVLAGLGWVGAGIALDRDPAWILAGLLVPALAGIQVLQSHALAFKDVVLARLPSELLRPVAALALFLALAPPLGATADTAMLGVVAAAWAVVLWLAVRTRQAAPQAVPTSAAADHRLWRATSTEFLGQTFFSMVMDRADILVVGAVHGAEAAAIYTVATSLGKFLLFALSAVNTIAAPMVSDLHVQGRRTEVQDLLRLGVAASTALALVGGVAFALLATPALALFGEGYDAGATALLWLLPGYAANAACGSAGLVVSMTGHQRVTWRVIAVAGLAMLALDAWWVPDLGLEGAAMARSAVMIAWNVVLAVYAARAIGYDPTLLSWLRSRRPD